MTLFKFISATIILLFTLTITYAQSNQAKNSKLTHIKYLYTQINDYKSYKTVTIDNSEEFLGQATDNGGNLTGYFKSDTLKKIIEWVGLSNRVVQNEYYFDNRKLFFVYSTESRYRFNDSTQSFNYSKLDKVFQGRYYFDNDKLIDTILSDKQHMDTKQDDAINFLISGKNYLKLLSSKLK